MSVPATIEQYQSILFSPSEELDHSALPSAVKARVLRLRALYTYWINFPSRSTREMVAQDREMHAPLSEREAYDDVKLVKVLLGNLEQESKEWHRHVFNKRIEEVYRAAIANGDLKTAERANADYAKFNRVGELDPAPADYEGITPHVIEPTDDPTVIGIAPIKDLRGTIRRLRKKLGADIQDADFIELPNNGTETKSLSQ